MNFVNGTVYKWYENQLLFSGADISINSGEVYLVKGEDALKKKVFLEIIAGIDNVNLSTLNYAVGLKNISYMPKRIIYYKSMKVKDLMTFYHDLYQNFDMEFADKWIKQSKINKTKRIKSLSKIERKVLGVIICLSFKVSLYVINEPFVENTNNLFISSILNTRYTESSSLIINTEYIDQRDLFTKVIDIRNHEEIKVHEFQYMQSKEQQR